MHLQTITFLSLFLGESLLRKHVCVVFLFSGNLVNFFNLQVGNHCSGKYVCVRVRERMRVCVNVCVRERERERERAKERERPYIFPI